MIIEITCLCCKRIFNLEVKEIDYKNWQNGEYIQDALPYLDASERELLISGMCGKCFDSLIQEDENV